MGQGRISKEQAVALWERRGEALRASSMLLDQKPDHEEWTSTERRVFFYASAVSRRLEKLH